MDAAQMAELLEDAEGCSKVLLSLYEILTQTDNRTLARLAWVAHLQAARSADAIAEALGVEADAA